MLESPHMPMQHDRVGVKFKFVSDPQSAAGRKRGIAAVTPDYAF